MTELTKSVSDICSGFISQSPPGQLGAMTEALRLLSPEVVNPGFIESTAKSYNSTHPRVITAPDGRKLVHCDAAILDASHIYDPKTNTVFAIQSQLTLAVEPSAGVGLPSKTSFENYRVALERKAEEYISKRFPAKNTAVAVYARDGHIIVCIVAENNNTKNFWSGAWTSHWSIDMKSPANAKTKGTVQIHAHYFEEVNTQLITNKTIPEKTILNTSDEHFASEVIEYIRSSENEIQTGLDEMYENMNDETFRAMRRTMPITRTKMEWNMNSLRMNRMVMMPVMPGMKK